jgi:hypothetical protein
LGDRELFDEGVRVFGADHGFAIELASLQVARPDQVVSLGPADTVRRAELADREEPLGGQWRGSEQTDAP